VTALDKLRQAQQLLLRKGPDGAVLAARSLSLEFKEDPKCPTGATDGKHHFYNSDWIESLSIERTMRHVGHEALHVMLLHCWRMYWRQTAPHEVLQIAADIVVNELLDKMDLGQSTSDMQTYFMYQLPKGKSFEWYIDALTNQGDKGGKQGPNQDTGRDDNRDREETGKGSDKPDSELPTDSSEDNKDDSVCSGDPESDSTSGISQSDNSDMGGFDGTIGTVEFDVKPAADTPEDLQAGETEALIQSLSIMQHAQGIGHFGGLFSGMLSEIKAISEMDWRKVLRQFIHTTACAKYTWTRPNSAYAQRGFYMPDYRRMPESGKLVFAPDLSGSTFKMRQEIFAELSQIGNQLVSPEITIVPWHSTVLVEGVKIYRKQDFPLKNIEFQGAGGTNVTPVLKWINEYRSRNRFSAAIIATDGYIDDYPETPLPFPVLWIIIGQQEKLPPWGRVVRVKL
jgi:predicted metal-dependent peptidase